VLEPIREGKLCFTSAAVLASVATEENLAEVLPRFHGLSKQEALELAAVLKPRKVVPTRTVVTQVDEGTAVVEIRPGELGMTRTEQERTIVERPGVERPATERTRVEPMTAASSRMHVTVSPEFLALLKTAKVGQSHVQPGATDEQVLTAAREALIEKQEKRRASVPPKVKREVRKRDGGKCTWPLANGGTCGSEVRTEIDHVVPRGRGGPSTVSNCRVLCDVHNREAARRVYGDEVMDLFTRGNPVAREPCAGYAPGYAAGGGVTSGPAVVGGTAGGANAIGSGACGMAIQSATYRMIPHPPAQMESRKSTRTTAIGRENRSARPRQTPAIIFPSRARYHSRWKGR
jgi:5-methylcytosine-specific restriction endonuclease McrA